MTSAGGPDRPRTGRRNIRPACCCRAPPPACGRRPQVAAANGFDRAVSFDMGGTSTDVCLIDGGLPEPAPSFVVGGYPVRLPALAIHTVGAGGGSIAGVDDGGAVTVGPRSAGAIPGPACYGHGGDQATVTDADLLLGRIPAGAELPGIGLPRPARRVVGDGARRRHRDRRRRRRRRCHDGGRARGEREPGDRPARLRARGVRRGRPAPRLRHRRGARTWRRWSCRRGPVCSRPSGSSARRSKLDLVRSVAPGDDPAAAAVELAGERGAAPAGRGAHDVVRLPLRRPEPRAAGRLDRRLPRRPRATQRVPPRGYGGGGRRRPRAGRVGVADRSGDVRRRGPRTGRRAGDRRRGGHARSGCRPAGTASPAPTARWCCVANPRGWAEPEVADG